MPVWRAFLHEKAAATPIPVVGFLIALVCALLAGTLGGLIYSVLTISLRANQNVSGLALTTFGVGVGNFFGGSLSKLSGGVGQISVATTASAFREKLPLLKDIPVLGEVLFSYGFLTYFAILLSVYLAWYINRTRRGLNLRAVGESPATADAAGISVTRYKYLATCIGGAICGLGGLYFVMEYSGGTWTNNGFGDRGWLAIALVIFARWNPLHAIWSSILFGALYILYLYIPLDWGSMVRFEDAALYRDHRGAGADQPSQEEGGSAAGEPGFAILPGRTVNQRCGRAKIPRRPFQMGGKTHALLPNAGHRQRLRHGGRLSVSHAARSRRAVPGYLRPPFRRGRGRTGFDGGSTAPTRGCASSTATAPSRRCAATVSAARRNSCATRDWPARR